MATSTPAPEAPPATAPPQHLLHHFDDLQQQHQSSMLGMWAFLATEVMFFGGLVLGYSIYRARYFEEFAAASRHLLIWVGFVNTIVLLFSSFTMAMAVRASRLGDLRWLVRWLVVTMALGTTFLGIKAVEYAIDYRDHLVPGLDFDWSLAETKHHTPGGGEPSTIHTARREAEQPDRTPAAGPELTQVTLPDGRKQEMFFVLYFFMTGLHALHLIIGIVLVGVIAYLAHVRWFSGAGQTQVETTGLYWHFIDIVWIFLYPLLYLIELRP
jgi:cytochrome c oxidase subunit 3